MVDKRPHTLTYQVEGTGTQDANGNYAANADGQNITLRCRADAKDGGKTIKREDGSEVVFGYMIYANTDIANIPVGQKIKVYRNGTLFFEGNVKRFEREQFKCRIWA